MPSSISTVLLVGMPSSSTVSEPAPFGDGAVINDGYALRCYLLAEQSGKGRRLLPVEIALKTVAYSFVKHHARPAAGKHDVKCSSGCRDCFQIDQSLPSVLHRQHIAIYLRSDEFAKALATACTIRAAFLPVAVADNDRYVQSDHRANIANKMSVGTQDFYLLP